MDWFKRYGISGSWFLILIIAWIYVLYPCKIKEADLKFLFGFIVITFLPIGYFIAILQQCIYLKFFGIHKKAKFLSKLDYPYNYEDEPALEVYSTLTIFKCMKFDYLKYYQGWVKRRMDVLVIDMTILLAAISAPIFALIFPQFLGWKPQLLNYNLFIGLIIISLLIVGIILWNIKIMRRQIIMRLTEIYCNYKEKKKKRTQNN
jgi:hypothetical protein